jgi:hypothetical protein
MWSIGEETCIFERIAMELSRRWLHFNQWRRNDEVRRGVAGSDGDSQGMAIQELECCQVVAGSTMSGTLVMLTLLYNDVVCALANGGVHT